MGKGISVVEEARQRYLAAFADAPRAFLEEQLARTNDAAARLAQSAPGGVQSWVIGKRLAINQLLRRKGGQ